MTRALKKFIWTIAFLLSGTILTMGYALNDFGSTTPGIWNSAATWSKWNGSAWVAAGATPSSTDNVFILSGKSVTLNSGGPYACKNLTVETTASLSANSQQNIYLYVWGTTIQCDGSIGNAASFDGISFGIEGANVTITGTGTFNASRLRKNQFSVNATSNLTISKDVTLKFGAGSQTQIYNSANGTSRFNVTISAGCTLRLDSTISAQGIASGAAGSTTVTVSSFTPNVTLASMSVLIGMRFFGTGISQGAIVTNVTGVGPYTVTLSVANSGTVSGNVYFVAYGNASMDGISGADATNMSGQYHVYGNFIVSGKYYAITNNTALTDSVGVIVYNGGYMRVGVDSTGTSGAAGHRLRVLPGGKFEISGAQGIYPASGFVSYATAKNVYDIRAGSYFEYSGNGANSSQVVSIIPSGGTPSYNASSGGYGYLTISGSGTKSLTAGVCVVNNDLTITNANGTPLLSPTANQVFQLYGNWINYSETGFSEGTTDVRFSGSTLQTISCPGGELFNTLRFTKSGTSTLRFLNDVTIKNQLLFGTAGFNDGMIDLNKNGLILRNPARNAISFTFPTQYIYAEDSLFRSYIKWNIGTPTGADSIYVFPFGKPNLSTGIPDTIPVVYVAHPATSYDSVTVSTYGTPSTNLPWPPLVTNLLSDIGLTPDNQTATVDRFWQITTTAAGSPAADWILAYTSSELPTYNATTPDQMAGQYWNTLMKRWEKPPAGTGSFAPLYYVGIPGNSTYGVWTLVNMSAPLPIELLTFTVQNKEKVVRTSWQTATETENDYFTVERSLDGRQFIPIGTVDGCGTCNGIHGYGFTDTQPLPGKSYYRLRQTDFDAQSSVSKVVAIFRGETKAELNLFPQPAHNMVVLKISNSEESKAVVEIVDIAGKVVLLEEQPVFAGYMNIDLSSLPQGIYVLRLQTQNNRTAIPLIKQ